MMWRSLILAQLLWRPLSETDLSGVGQIALATFPCHYEDPACFAERLSLSPRWSFGLEDWNGRLKGYLFAYPWPFGTIPPLNARLGAVPDQSRALFLHDLAIDPEARGTGQARAIVEQVARDARREGFCELTLVAVNNTAKFWQGRGFTIVNGRQSPHDKLSSYGADACYMRRRLA
jgi:GNAT superfamily N-acetyltransferase